MVVDECPICTSPHDTQHGVALHMVRKDDAEHDAVEDLAAAYDRLYDGGTETPTQEATDGGSTTDGGGEVSRPEFPEADDAGESGDGGDTAPAAAAQAATDAESGGAETCPACESDDVKDATAYLRKYSDRLEPEHRKALSDGDHVCGDCGGVW